MSSKVASMHPHMLYGSGHSSELYQHLGKGRVTSSSRLLHIQGHHVKKFQCDFCGYETLYPFALKRHRRKHTGDAFFCDLCPKRFWDRSKLIYHMKGHRGELVCKFCLKQFQTKNGQYRHEMVCSTAHSGLVARNMDQSSTSQ